MAKTVFSGKMKILNAWLNKVFSHRHDGQDADGSAPLDYAANDTGSANAYAFALTPVLTQYITGMPMWFKAANANTGASTCNVNGLGNRTIIKGGNALIAGDILAGQIYCLIDDGTNLQLHGTYNAAKVNGIEASTTAQANKLVALGSNLELPTGVICKLSRMRRAEIISSNTSQVTIMAATTEVLTLNVGTVYTGDRILIHGFIAVTKGGIAGEVIGTLNKSTGTATIEFYQSLSSVSRKAPGLGPSANAVLAFSEIIQVTATGTLTLRFTGQSVNSNSEVYVGYSHMHATVLDNS